MEINYQILYQEHVIKNHIPSLSVEAKALVKISIETKLIIDPIFFGKPLRYSLKGHRCLRINDYKIVYIIKGNTVIIILITHRKGVYF